MDVQVRRSERRRKTVQARMIDGTLHIAIPGHMSAAEEAHWVDHMRAKFERQGQASAIDLVAAAARLAKDHDLPRPTAITWSDRQKTLWGSCTPSRGQVRIASRIAGYPLWVVDYVIVHELAHLVIPDHGRGFWDLVGRYPLAERAQGYLLAKADGG